MFKWFGKRKEQAPDPRVLLQQEYEAALMTKRGTARRKELALKELSALRAKHFAMVNGKVTLLAEEPRLAESIRRQEHAAVIEYDESCRCDFKPDRDIRDLELRLGVRLPVAPLQPAPPATRKIEKVYRNSTRPVAVAKTPEQI